MMKNAEKIVQVCILAVTMMGMLLISSCGSHEQAKAPEQTSAPVSAPDTVAPSASAPVGTVTFLCGIVTLTSGGAASPLDIGMGIPVDASITTDKDAVCEVQFSTFGSVHIDSGSTLVVNKFISDSTHTESEMSLKAGKVVCKVKKLSGDDSFQVRTDEMVCGVRGTVFQVSREENKPVHIAVSEGSVAVYPPSIDTIENAGDTVAEAVHQSAPVVAAGEEASLTAKTLQKLDESLAEVIQAVEKNPEAKVEDTLVAYKKISASVVTDRAPVSAVTKADFREAANLELASASEASQAKIPVSVTVIPPEAAITLNGSSVFHGSFSGMYADGEKLQLKIELEGYRSVAETVSVSGSSPIQKTISLEKRDSEKPAAVASPIAATSAVPAKPVESAKPKAVPAVFPVSSSKLIAIRAAESDVWIVIDSKSSLSAVDSTGTVLWTAGTGNGTNTLNPPVTGGGVVAFSGDKTLTVLDEATGKQLWTLALDKTNTGLYGRHPAIAKNRLFIAGDSGLVAYDLKTGAASGSVPVDGGSDMSPSFAGGFLYIVSKSGSFMKINPDTFAIEKRLETGAVQPVASSPVVSGNTVIFADRKGTVFAVSADTASFLWLSKLDAVKNVDVFIDPVVAAGGVYVYAKGKIFGLSLKSGEKLFDPIEGATSQGCFADSLIWYGAGANIVAIDPSTGVQAKKSAVAATVSGAPVNAGSRLFAPLAGGQLLSFPTGD